VKHAYVALFAVVLVAAIGLTLAGRRGSVAPRPEAVEAARPVTNVNVVIENGSVTPARTTVQKGHDVHLRIESREARDVRVELSGYTDRVSVGLAAGAVWEGAFPADRPGEDFVWLIDGTPSGRFDVSGSHLVEGHR
jgi:hypothetical protein